MNDNKFYVCKHCGNIVGKVHDSGVPIVCCGEPMSILEPNIVEASTEKHLPVVTIENNQINVKVGLVAHPMEEVHHIEWIYLETENGGQRKALVPGQNPEVTFSVVDDKPIAVYEYCNIHGLWKTTI